METTANSSQTAAENSTEPAIAPTAERFAKKAHETIDRVSDGAVRTEQELRDSIAKAEAQLQAYRQKAEHSAEEQVEQVRTFIEKKPVQSAGIAFAAGLILSRLLR
jgi:ElaB/YqjD/DUF883 family membrane-anchored ribosome-binding protein